MRAETAAMHGQSDIPVTYMCTRDGKVTKPSKNEPNQNPGFTKNRTWTRK